MSIYGNPITLGGGGGLKATDALLRVQAPAGSTVTITKGGVTKTDAGHENADDNSVYDYYFIIHQSQFDSQNAWTVTATSSDQTQTATASVTISAADEYDVELSYTLWLYNQGNTYDSITGGWSKVSSGTLTLDTNEMKFVSGGSNTERYAATENAIDLTNYNTLYFNAYCNATHVTKCGIASTRSGSLVSSVNLTTQGTSYSLVSIDISSITGSYYIEFSNASSGVATYVNQIYAAV